MKKSRLLNIKKEIVVKTETPDLCFSPRRTRNQRRQIKVETEHANKNEQSIKELAFAPKKLCPRQTTYVEDILGTESEEQKRVKEEVKKEPETKALKWEPLNWRLAMDNIRKMREKYPAPVDSMGCSQCLDVDADDKTKRYHCLLSLMLSSQTKDEITFAAMSRLKDRFKPLVPQAVVSIDSTELGELLKPVSFYRVKAKNIQLTSQMLIDELESDIPDSIEGLLKLPGVGKKMAYLAMNSAWDKITGIGVDTHVHRISNWLQWVPKLTKTPEETRVALEKWLPYELWDDVNIMLVGFGQTVCKAVRPKCDICLNSTFCPAKQNPKDLKSPRKPLKKGNDDIEDSY